MSLCVSLGLYTLQKDTERMLINQKKSTIPLCKDYSVQDLGQQRVQTHEKDVKNFVLQLAKRT